METETTYHRARALDEAAAIWAGGAEFIGLEARSHRSFNFLFQPAATADRLAQEFQHGTLLVNARRLANCLTALKDAIFNRLRNGDRIDTTNHTPRI